MEKFRIKVEEDKITSDLECHWDFVNEHRMYCKVYFVYVCTDGSIVYQDKISSTIYKELNKDCKVMFELTVDWRGCWDCRFYPADTEYWDFELEVMSLAQKQILPILKNNLKESFKAYRIEE